MATLEEELAAMKQQLQGLAAERNQYRQEVESLKGQMTQGQQQFQRPASFMPGTNRHPLSQYIGDGDYSGVDQYYDGRYVPVSQFQTAQQNYQQQMQRVYQQAMNDALANIHLFRGVDRVLSNPEYKDLANWDSPLAKKTLEIMQAQGWGKPLEGGKSWNDISYTDVGGLEKAARMARAEAHFEAQQQQASQQQAQQTQQAAGMTQAPAGGTGTTPPAWTKPDFASIPNTEEGINQIINAVETAPESVPR